MTKDKLFTLFIALIFLGSTASNPYQLVLADGDSDDPECEMSLNDNTNDGDTATIVAPLGQIIIEICIKSGNQHPGGLISTDSTINNCYVVEGIDTSEVTVTRIGSGPECQEISHLDGDSAVPPTQFCDTVTCNDGNACTIDSCDEVNNVCVYDAGIANGLSCGDGSDTECTDPDTCFEGACLDNHATDGSACGDVGDECTNADACVAGACQDNGFKVDTTACGDPTDDECNNPDHCSGTDATCIDEVEPSGTSCGDGEAACVNQDLCDGTGSCTDNGFKVDTTACGDPTDDECNNPDHCSGTDATCIDEVEPSGTLCGVNGVECHVDDTCDGVGGCTDNGDQIDGTDCSIGQCGAGICEFIIDKFYTFTNNNWNLRCGTTENPAHVEGDQCIDDNTGLSVPFRFANVNEDGYNNIFAQQLPPPPDDGNDPFYLIGEVKGKKTVINPGQYIAVSLIDILKEEPITVTEDFSDCSDASLSFIGNINPPKAPGGVQVVLILLNGDVLDIDDLLAAGIGGSITFGEAGGSPLIPDSAIVSITDWNALGAALGIADLDPEMGQLRVMVKFQPDDRTTPPLIGTTCTNIESVSNGVNNGMDTADLTVIAKTK